jgi:sialate O-acetylesterase
MLMFQSVPAAVTVAAPFTDHAVLQQGIRVPVWGKAMPGEKILVSYSGRSERTTADANGRWRLNLPPMPPRLTGKLVVAGEANTITLTDVVTGEVWLCSGQSNMNFLLRDANDATNEIANAGHPEIREFRAREVIVNEPDDTGGGRWVPCQPDSAGRFSAVAYFFALELSAALRSPIGIITAANGGTTVETWTSKAAIAANPELSMVLERWNEELKLYPQQKAAFDIAMAAWEKQRRDGGVAGRRPDLPPGPGHPHSLAGHFNGMIYPLVPYALRGALWYQGESNAPHPEEYERLCRTMIQDWRARWDQGPFPFILIQLPRHLRFPEDPTGVAWAFIREAQMQLLRVTNAGLAITLELGDTAELHPRNKREFAQRAALVARALAYHQQIPFSGPLFRSATFEKGQVRLSFDHTNNGLSTQDGRPLGGFQIAAQDRSFVDANARIEGKCVVVSSPRVAEPVAVRYAWSNDPVKANLANGEGLPASPFRTDNWPK